MPSERAKGSPRPSSLTTVAPYRCATSREPSVDRPSTTMICATPDSRSESRQAGSSASALRVGTIAVTAPTAGWVAGTLRRLDADERGKQVLQELHDVVRGLV